MNKKVPIVILVVAVVLVVLGLVLGFYKEFSDAKEEKKELEEKIVTQYNNFKDEVEVFNDTRSTYYSTVVDDLFPETLKDNYEDWKLVLDKYTDSINDVDKNTKYLKEKCIGVNHVNQDIANKCDSFIIAYETVVNYYTKDIKAYNEVVNSYLEDTKDDKIVEYELKYDYTDINSDGKFIGKD